MHGQLSTILEIAFSLTKANEFGNDFTIADAVRNTRFLQKNGMAGIVRTITADPVAELDLVGATITDTPAWCNGEILDSVAAVFVRNVGITSCIIRMYQFDELAMPIVCSEFITAPIDDIDDFDGILLPPTASFAFVCGDEEQGLQGDNTSARINVFTPNPLETSQVELVVIGSTRT